MDEQPGTVVGHIPELGGVREGAVGVGLPLAVDKEVPVGQVADLLHARHHGDGVPEGTVELGGASRLGVLPYGEDGLGEAVLKAADGDGVGDDAVAPEDAAHARDPLKRATIA